MPFRGHHIWCNGDSRVDPKKCKWCIGLMEKYPEDGLTPEELVKKQY